MGKKNKRKGHPKPKYTGKPLWQLLENLLTVDMATNTIKTPNKPNKRKIPVTVERVFRGVIFLRLVNIQSTSYLSDFILISETEESKFLRNSKTASECNYVYWSAAQKRRIREMIAAGLSPAEAKQREKEKIAKDEAEVQGCGVLNQNQTNFGGNSDEEGTDELCDSLNYSKEKVEEYSALSKETFSGQSNGPKRSCIQSSMGEEVNSAKWTKIQ